MTWGVLQTKPQKPPTVDTPPKEYTTVGPKILKSYPKQTINVLSVIQLICGIFCIVLGVLRIYVTEHVHRIRYDVGICEGVFFLVTGIIGIVSAFNKTRGLIVSAAVSSGISSVLALFLGIGWLAYGLLRHGCRSRRRHRIDDGGLRKRPYDRDDHRHDKPGRGDKDEKDHTDRPHSRDFTSFMEEKWLMMKIVDWILLALFVLVVVSSIMVVVKAVQALKKKRRESTVDTQETQVFVITAEKAAVIS